jgi:hypothetical protein
MSIFHSLMRVNGQKKFVSTTNADEFLFYFFIRENFSRFAAKFSPSNLDTFIIFRFRFFPRNLSAQLETFHFKSIFHVLKLRHSSLSLVRAFCSFSWKRRFPDDADKERKLSS